MLKDLMCVYLVNVHIPLRPHASPNCKGVTKSVSGKFSVNSKSPIKIFPESSGGNFQKYVLTTWKFAPLY